MTVTSKSPFAPEQGHEQQHASSFYGNDLAHDELIADIDDEVIVRRDQTGRFVSDNERLLTGKFADAFDRASESVQRTARKAAERAQFATYRTAEAAREHPGMTAAVVGGLVTAAIAGVGLYASRRREPISPSATGLPKRPVAAKKTTPKQKG